MNIDPKHAFGPIGDRDPSEFSPLKHRDRILTVVKPFAGENPLHPYKPPFNLARFDTLTGLANRRALNERLERASSNGETLGLILLDLEAHPIEAVGAKLRAMMPWLKKDQLVDKTKN